MPSFGIAAGLIAAVSFGAGDFIGAVAARRAGPLVVVAGAHGAALLALLIGALVVRPPIDDPAVILIGLAAGIGGAVGLASLYRGMSLGSMGVVTSLSGAGSLIPPLVVGAVLDAPITALQLVGVAFAGAAGVAAGGAARDTVGRQALLMAGLAAVGFGGWYVLLDLAAEAGDPLWALLASRASSAVLTAAVVARRFDARALPLRLVVAAGLLDVGGNAFYVLSRDLLPLGLAAALTGLFPIGTMVLARVILGERLTRLGQVGVALALLGIVLISAGG